MRVPLAIVAIALLTSAPFASGAEFDANLIVLSVEGATPTTTGYDLQQTAGGKTYALTARLADLDGTVYVNVTSPANKRATDASTLEVSFPTDWLSTETARDVAPRVEATAVPLAFTLGDLPLDPPPTGAVVRARVDTSTFVLTLLPPLPILVLDVPAEDGVAYVDATADAPIPVRTLYFVDGDRLTGPAKLGLADLGIPSKPDVKPGGKMEVKTSSAVPCGANDLTIQSSKGATVSTRTGTVFAKGAGAVSKVALVRAPTIEAPGGFVSDVAPAEFVLRCFPPGSTVELAGETAGGATATLGRFLIGPGGGLEDVLSFPATSLAGLVATNVTATLVDGPSVLDASRFVARASVPVRAVESAEDLVLVVDATLDRVAADLGDRPQLAGTVTLGGEPAEDVDVTVVWPFVDAASTRADGLASRVLRTGADGSFSGTLSAAPTGAGTSLAAPDVSGVREVALYARKAGFSTGVARLPLVATGVAPLHLTELAFRPEVPQPGGLTTLTGRVQPASPLVGFPAGLVEGALVEARADFLAEPVTGRATRDGHFSLDLPVPAGTPVAEFPVTVLAWGPAPEAVEGILTGVAAGRAHLEVGSLTADPIGRAQRANVAVDPTGELPLASVLRGLLGETTQAVPGAEIKAGDRLVVGEGGRLLLNMPDQRADIELGPASRATLALHGFDGPTAVTMLLLDTPGTALVDGTEVPGSLRELLVRTRFHDVRAVGADAVVEALADGGTAVQVWSGAATVADRAGALVEVPAGKQLVLGAADAPAAGLLAALTGANPFDALTDGLSSGTSGGVVTPPTTGTPGLGVLAVVAAAAGAVLLARRKV